MFGDYSMKLPRGGSGIKIVLLGIVYAVVIAYGLQFIDKAATVPEFIRIGLVYVVIIVDWVYLHSEYMRQEDERWEYQSNLLFGIDIAVLFLLSRALSSSTGYPPTNYWKWMFFLFLFYAFWNVATRIKKMPTEHKWLYSLGVDSFAAFAFGVLFLGLSGQLRLPAFCCMR